MKCLDLAGGNTTNGAAVQIWDCNGDTNQQWYFNEQTLAIQSYVDDKKCIDLPGSSTVDGNKLWIWDCTGGKNQQWRGGGYYQWQSMIDDTKCIDLYGGDSADGKQAELWDCIAPSPGPATGGFPVTEVQVSQDELNTLKGGSQQQKEVLATAKILPQLQVFFNKADHAIEVSVGDATFAESFPDCWVACGCSGSVCLENPKGELDLKAGTKLEFGLKKIDWKGATVFIDGEIDCDIGIDSSVKVETGWSALPPKINEWFGIASSTNTIGVDSDITVDLAAKSEGIREGDDTCCKGPGSQGKHKCHKIAQKTTGVKLKATGHNALGMQFTASNARVENDNGKYSVVFDFKVDTVTLALDWDLTKIDLSGCNIKILGIQIFSYCGFLTKILQKQITKFTTKTATMTAPALADKLQKLIQTKIGSEVKIPLKL